MQYDGATVGQAYVRPNPSSSGGYTYYVHVDTRTMYMWIHVLCICGYTYYVHVDTRTMYMWIHVLCTCSNFIGRTFTRNVQDIETSKVVGYIYNATYYSNDSAYVKCRKFYDILCRITGKYLECASIYCMDNVFEVEKSMSSIIVHVMVALPTV